MTAKLENTAKPPSLKVVLTKIQSLNDRHDRLAKEVRSLKDLLNTEDNWHAETRKWIGKRVAVTFGGEQVQGIFKWADRYNICLVVLSTPRIFPKGMISLQLAEESDAS